MFVAFYPLNFLSLQKVLVSRYFSFVIKVREAYRFIRWLEPFPLLLSAAAESPSPKPELQCNPPIYFSYREALGDLTALTSDSSSDSDNDVGEGK